MTPDSRAFLPILLAALTILALSAGTVEAQTCAQFESHYGPTSTYWDPTSCCNDGVDNDGDGAVDGADTGCVIETRFAAAGAGSGLCTDSFDNDGDGYVDGWGSGADDSCLVETRRANPQAINFCADGIDNDGDSLLDGQGGTPVPTPPITQDPECRGEVYCKDGFDNDGDGLIDGADDDCQCMLAATGYSGCTAKDFNVAFTADPADIVDGCVNTSDRVTVRELRATLTAAQSDRYDLATWINLEGASNAITGNLCLRQIFTPTFISATYPPIVGPQSSLGFQGYPVIESKVNERDICGDLGGGVVGIYDYPVPVEVPCNDVLPNGYVDLGQCGSWQNNTQDVCSSVTEGEPGTTSKCQCATNETGLSAPNVRTSCTSGIAFEPDQTVTIPVSFTNTVTAACSPGGGTAPLFYRDGCGTAAFLRIVVSYGNAETRGDFTFAGSPISTNPLSPTAIATPPYGYLYQDTANNRIIWAPVYGNALSPAPYGTPTVVGPFTGTATLNLEYTLTDDSGTSPLSLQTTLWWDAAADADLNSTISPSEAVDLTGSIAQVAPSCTSGCECSFANSTTPITLASFAATAGDLEASFEWTTATEIGNVGFHLYAETPSGRVRLNDTLIPAQGNGLEPQSYRASFPVPEGATGFVLEDVDLKGRGREHRAIKPGESRGAPRELAPIAWQQVREETVRATATRGQRLAAAVRAGLDATRDIELKAARVARPATPPIELVVSADGLYRLTYEDLVAEGFDLLGTNSARLGLSSRGVGVPIHVGGGTRFGPGSFIEFRGEALDTLYTAENVYRLETSAQRPARVALDSTPPPAATPASYYLETREFERNREYAYWSPLADPFYDTTLYTFTSPRATDFPFAIDGFVPGVSPATLEVRLFGMTDFPRQPDHHVRFELNGTEVGGLSFDGQEAVVFTATLPEGLLRDGNNLLTLRLPGDTGAPWDFVALESWSVTFPRVFAATGDGIRFSGSASRYEVAGLSSPAAVAYRVAGSQLTRLNGTAVVPGAGGGFVAVVPGEEGRRRGPISGSYEVAAEAALLKPAIRPGRVVSAEVSQGAADYLVISHPAFLDGLGPLVAARRAEGRTVKVVDVEDLFSLYSGGTFDAEAIRTYIALAARSLGTRMVLLVGGDTFDYRDFLGYGAVSFLPSLYVPAGPFVRFAPSDSAFADVDRDGVPDLAIGRLPVRTPADLATVVQKIFDYETKSYGRTGFFTADFSDPGASMAFSAASERFIASLAPAWSVARAYPDNEPLASVRTRLKGAINEGVALVSFVGHSDMAAWGGVEILFELRDVPGLTNTGAPTAVVQWGCWNTYYASPRAESLGNALLMAGDRGAAAVLGATTLTNDDAEIALGEFLFPLLTTRRMPIGDAIVEAKNLLAQTRPDLSDVLLGWNLLGDPAMVIEP